VVDQLVQTHVGGSAGATAEFAHVDLVDGSFPSFLFLAFLQGSIGLLTCVVELAEDLVGHCVDLSILHSLGSVVMVMNHRGRTL